MNPNVPIAILRRIVNFLPARLDAVYNGLVTPSPEPAAYLTRVNKPFKSFNKHYNLPALTAG